MKVHKHLVSLIVDVLQNIFIRGGYADKEIEKLFKSNRKLGSRDRKFIAESVYELVRWWKLYFYYAYIYENNYNSSNSNKNLTANFNEDLCFDEKFLNNSKFLTLIWTMWWIDKKQDSDFAVLDFMSTKETAEIIKFLKIQKEKKISRDLQFSIPLWMDKYGEAQFGELWSELVQSLNSQAQVYLRTNTLKTDRDSLIVELAKEGIQTKSVDEVSSAVVLNERKNVFITNAFKMGWFEMQDVASQMVAPFLQTEPGLRVVDACAGAGGKSLHLAQIMKNKGKIISMDIHQWKLDELRKRARRGGVDIIETKCIENSKTIKRMEKSCDRLLLDVPCTGFGVLRRNPDRKWKMSLQEINELADLQGKIINEYSTLLKVNGLMVYATCSILPVENEDQVKDFLEKNKNFILIEELKVDPVKTGYDGFYAALIKRLS